MSDLLFHLAGHLATEDAMSEGVPRPPDEAVSARLAFGLALCKMSSVILRVSRKALLVLFSRRSQ